MSEDLALTVILLTRNGAATIGRQLEALANQSSSEPWELLVVDNGSSDRTLEIVKEYRRRLPSLRVVDASADRGAAHTCNIGAREARGRALAFCHDDDEVGAGWLEAMMAALRKHDVVGARLEVDKLNEPWTIAFRGRPQTEGPVSWDLLSGYPPYLFGATLGVTRAAYERIGGFDETILPSSEDMDYCWRALAAGFQLHFAPEAVIHYRYRATWSGIYRQARGYGIGNVRLYKKYSRLGLPTVPNPGRLLVRRWLFLMKLLLQSRNRGAFARFVWTLGIRVGLLRESVRQRVLLP